MTDTGSHETTERLSFEMRRDDVDAKAAQASGHLRAAGQSLELVAIHALIDEADDAKAVEMAYEHVGQAMAAILAMRKDLST